LRRFRQLLGDLAGLAGDETLKVAELRSRLRGLIAPFEPERTAAIQVAAVRQELGRKSQQLARLLKMARAAEWFCLCGWPPACKSFFEPRWNACGHVSGLSGRSFDRWP
jgi:hypothetical protein